MVFSSTPRQMTIGYFRRIYKGNFFFLPKSELTQTQRTEKEDNIFWYFFVHDTPSFVYFGAGFFTRYKIMG